MKINICLVSDNNYIKYLASTLISILENADDNDSLNIFIITDNISDYNKSKILSLAKNRNCEIKFINIDSKLFNELPNYKISKHITKIGYARLFSAELLKDIDKVIYLDCDTIVLSSLKNLFETDIEKYYIAGAADAGLLYNIKYCSDFYKNFEIYINTGVLLINLKLWRQDNISIKLVKSIEQNKDVFMLGDQDVLNFVCKDRIKLIDFSYNLQPIPSWMKDFVPDIIKKNLKKSINNPNIIHYSTHSKPWNSHTYLKKYYLKYEKLNPLNAENKFKLKLKHFSFFLKWLLRKPYSKLKPLIKKFF